MQPRQSFVLFKNPSSRCLGRRLRGGVAALNILRPVTNVLLWIEDQIGRAWHMMLALSLAHIVMRAIGPILMVTNVAILLRTGHIMGFKSKFI